MSWRSRLIPVAARSLGFRRNASSSTSGLLPPLSSLNSSSRRSNLLMPTESSSLDVRVSDINSRLNTVHLTASYLSGMPMAQMEISLPSVLPKEIHCPTSEGRAKRELEVPSTALKVEIADPRAVQTEISDPTSAERNAPKLAKLGVVLLRIRKRKMKVHKRRKHRKKHFAAGRKYKFNKEKKKETVFRVSLMDKISRAKEFDARAYVDDYLEEVYRPLTPVTFKGARHPDWFIKELILNEKLEKERRELMKTNLMTGEPLVKPGETVEQFVERMKSEK